MWWMSRTRLLLLLFLCLFHLTCAFDLSCENVWCDWFQDIVNDSPHRGPVEKEMKDQIYKPNIHDIIEEIDSIEPTELSTGQRIRLDLPAFSYQFYQLKLPSETLQTNETGYMFIQTTAYSGEYSVYIHRDFIPSYYRRQEFALSGQGGVAILFSFSSDDDVMYLSLEGNRKVIWTQYEYIHDPRYSALSFVISEIRYSNSFSQTIVDVENSVSEFSQVTPSLPMYYSYNSTGTSNSSLFILASGFFGTTNVYVSKSNPYPSSDFNDYSFVVYGSTNTPYILAEVYSGGMFYVSYQTSDLQANQFLLFHEGEKDIEIIEGSHVYMKRHGNNAGPYYKLRVPGTSAYKWMKVLFQGYSGLSLYVKAGERPTRLKYDWVWHFPKEDKFRSSYEELYISALDANFNGGDFYFWFYVEDESHYEYDYIRISMTSWSPRYI
mmetsp:Transcript_22565/g.28818  ORF Transcript_22565/g.28818 Transcript_22565/m.28818 type:complete len:436 (-) Transcript_22565:34-1341(-)